MSKININYQCNMDDESHASDGVRPRMMTKPPIYCSFIPFLGYKWSA